MFTVLIADDEERILRLVSDFLKRDGHQVITARNGQEAMDTINQDIDHIDVAILDVMMPFYDGWSILRHIKKISPTTTVIMLTARAEELDEVMGFDLGADDYITKPFSPVVLAARVRALEKKKSQNEISSVTTLGVLKIDEIRRETMVNNQVVDLTPKEYELLIYLKNNKNIALSRESILNSVWGYDYYGDLRTVDTHIKKLRAKLCEAGKYIETVRGFGYRFDL